MSMIRSLAIAAASFALAAGSAFADPPAAKAPAEKKADKPADKTAKPADKPTTDKPADTKPADVKKAQLSDAEAQQFVAFFDKLVTVIVANKADCTKLAAAINAHMDANANVIKAMTDAEKQNKHLAPEVKAKITKRVTEELAPAMTEKCGEDKAVLAAFMRLRPSK